MTVTYHSGGRIQATSTDFNSGDGISAVAGGWVEVGRTTLGSAGDIIDVTSLPDKRYYMLLTDYRDTGGQLNTNLTLNNDTGNNYARRWSTDGAGDSTQINRDSMNHGHYTANDGFAVAYLSNLTSKEKLFISHSVVNHGGTGSGTSPNRNEWVGKWTNTSNAVSRMTTTNTDTGTYDTGSEVVVLGWDPDDTHTTNFWEELASVSGAGSSTTLSSGTITAKKYLWVQVYADTATSACGFQFNNDTGANYSRRYNMNGGSDGAHLNHTSANISGNSPNVFINCFIINNSANEKLLMCNTVYAPASGAGDDPERSEDYSKWANTSSQITEIDVIKGSNWGTNSIIKVWGSD